MKREVSVNDADYISVTLDVTLYNFCSESKRDFATCDIERQDDVWTVGGRQEKFIDSMQGQITEI